MADSSDEFFNSYSFGGTSTERAGALQRNKAIGTAASSTSYRPVPSTAVSAPPPPPRPSRPPSVGLTLENSLGASGEVVQAALSNSSDSTRAKAAPRPASSIARASRPPVVSSGAARPSNRKLEQKSTAGGITFPASSNGTYFGGTPTAGSSGNPNASNLPNPSSSYYSSSPAPDEPQPSLYGPHTSGHNVPYRFAAPSAGASSAGYNYGRSGPGQSFPSSGGNPYLLSTASTNNALSGTMDASASFSGPMDTAAQHSMFIPQKPPSLGSTPHQLASQLPNQPYNAAEFEDEPPLLEELGINVEHIIAKTRSVVLPFSRFKGTISDSAVIQDGDLAGPIALGLLLGGELMLSGKLQFGYIYGFGLFGCVSMTLILNFMSPHDAISIWTVTSILGYSLLPVNLLAALKLFVVNLGNLQLLGQFLGFLTVLWSTVASTRLMEQGCGMRDQRYLIAYPIGLLYTAFVMITIF